MAAEVLVVGLSHRTAPVEVRERLAVATERMGAELRAVIEAHPVTEGVLISTCNRVELYAVASDPVIATGAMRAYLKGRTPDNLDEYLYERLGKDAIRHAFRVAASLDSMVVGEPQILGQVKEAYSAAHSAGSVGALLGRCFHRAFAVAKRVRTETGIATGAVSVSSIAIELAEKIFGDLSGRNALLIGAGKMSEAAAKSLAKRGARLFVVNRSPERAEQLARACGGVPRPYDRMTAELATADVAITSTASPKFILTPDMMHEVIRARRNKPLFVIDIAVPRDVDPRVGEMRNVFLYDVDDLQKVAEENLTARSRAAADAELIVEQEAEMFEQWRRSLTLTPTIVALRARFREVLAAELERTVPRLEGLTDKDRRMLAAMSDAMVNKLLHQPLTQLKNGADGPDGPNLIDATRRLFNLEGGPQSTDDSEQEDEVVGSLTPAESSGGEGS